MGVSETTNLCAKGWHLSIFEMGIKKVICRGLTIAFDCLACFYALSDIYLHSLNLTICLKFTQWSEFCENTALAISVSFGINMEVIKKTLLFSVI